MYILLRYKRKPADGIYYAKAARKKEESEAAFGAWKGLSSLSSLSFHVKAGNTRAASIWYM